MGWSIRVTVHELSIGASMNYPSNRPFGIIGLLDCKANRQSIPIRLQSPAPTWNLTQAQSHSAYSIHTRSKALFTAKFYPTAIRKWFSLWLTWFFSVDYHCLRLVQSNAVSLSGGYNKTEVVIVYTFSRRRLDFKIYLDCPDWQTTRSSCTISSRKS